MACLTSLQLLGCGGVETETESTESVAIQRSDSAGVEIVRIHPAHLEALPIWRPSTGQLTSIGQVDGSPAHVFTAIDREGVAVFGDGLAIVDGFLSRGSREVRLFDRDGTFLSSLGSAGEGPGEFRELPLIQRSNEGTLLAIERENGRITEFDRGGELIGTRAADLAGCPYRLCTAQGLLSNGVPVMLSVDQILAFQLGASDLGREIGDLWASFGLDEAGSYREVGRLPQPPHHVRERAESQMVLANGRTVQLTAYAAVTPLFSLGPEALVAVGSRYFAVAAVDPFSIRLFDGNGTLARVIHLDVELQGVTAADVEEALERLPPPARFRDHPAATVRPPFSYLRFGDDDDLWIFLRPSPTTSGQVEQLALVIGVDGTPVARVEIPSDPVIAGQSKAARYQAPSSRDELRLITEDGVGVNRLLIMPLVPADADRP